MEILEILKMIAPGTQIREGLDSILKAKTGALIVIRWWSKSDGYSWWRF